MAKSLTLLSAIVIGPKILFQELSKGKLGLDDKL